MKSITYILSLTLLVVVFLINLTGIVLASVLYLPVWIICMAVFSPVAYSQAKKRGRNCFLWTLWTALGMPIFTNILLLVLGNTNEKNEENWERQADAIARAHQGVK